MVSRLCTLFRRISDSRFTWICDFEELLTKSVGPVPFSTQYLICRHVQTDRQTDGQTDRQTDGQTDELIRVELGNAMVPPGKISWLH